MRFLLLSIAFALCLSSYSQETKVMEDLELWTGAKYINPMLGKKFNISLESEARFKNNMSEFSLLYFEPAIQYKPNMFMEIGAEYRFSHKISRKGKKDNYNRIGAHVVFKQKVKRLSVSYRLKYLGTDDDIPKAELTGNYENAIRNRLQLKYNINNNPLSPFIASELFTALNASSKSNYNLRITLGTDYKLNKANRLKLFYRIDRELNLKHPYTYYIVGTRYIFKH